MRVCKHLVDVPLRRVVELPRVHDDEDQPFKASFKAREHNHKGHPRALIRVLVVGGVPAWRLLGNEGIHWLATHVLGPVLPVTSPQKTDHCPLLQLEAPVQGETPACLQPQPHFIPIALWEPLNDQVQTCHLCQHLVDEGQRHRGGDPFVGFCSVPAHACKPYQDKFLKAATTYRDGTETVERCVSLQQ
jgi:hypothetical protein